MSEGTKKTIQASKILEEIQRNQHVYYESVVVEGDFDIRKLDLQIRHVERTESQKEIGFVSANSNLTPHANPILIHP